MVLIFKYEKGRVSKKNVRGEHPAKSAEADHCIGWSTFNPKMHVCTIAVQS